MSNKYSFLGFNNKNLNLAYVNKEGDFISLINFNIEDDKTKMQLTDEGKIFFNNAFSHIEDQNNIKVKEFFKILSVLKIEKSFISKYSTSRVMDFNTFAQIAKEATEKEVTAFLINDTVEQNLEKYEYAAKINPMKLFIMKQDKSDFHNKLDKVFDEKTFQMDAVIVNSNQTLGKKVIIRAFSDMKVQDYIQLNKTILKTLEDYKITVPKIQIEKTNDRLYWIETDVRSSHFEYVQGLVNKSYLKSELQTPLSDYFERLTGKLISNNNLGYLYAVGTIVYEHNKKEQETPETAFNKIEQIIENRSILEQVSKNKIVQDIYTMLAFNLQIGNEQMNLNAINVIQDMSGSNKIQLGAFKDIEAFALVELNGDSFLNGKTLSKLSVGCLSKSKFSILSKLDGFKSAWGKASDMVIKLKENISLNEEISIHSKETFINYFEKPLSSNTINKLIVDDYSKTIVEPKPVTIKRQSRGVKLK